MSERVEKYRGFQITRSTQGYSYGLDGGFLKLEFCKAAIDEALRVGSSAGASAREVAAVVLDSYDAVRCYGHGHETALMHARRAHGVPSKIIETMLRDRHAAELERHALLAQARDTVINLQRKQG